MINFQTDRYKPIGIDVLNRFGEDASERIPVRAGNVPDLSFQQQLPRRGQFSLFIPKHRQMASRLIEIFMSNFCYLLLVLI